MMHKQTYNWKQGLWAILLLTACCYMTMVKMLHHHTVLPVHDIVCTIDGESMSQHEAHHHTSFLPTVNSDDDCAICKYQVLKVQKTGLAVLFVASQQRENLYLQPTPLIQQGVSEKRRTRAPPCA